MIIQVTPLTSLKDAATARFWNRIELIARISAFTSDSATFGHITDCCIECIGKLREINRFRATTILETSFVYSEVLKRMG